jgi:hypothetical protein
LSFGRGALGFAPAPILIFRHRNTIHNQEISTAFLASLARHKNLIEGSGSSDSGFQLAVWANHTRLFSRLKNRIAEGTSDLVKVEPHDPRGFDHSLTRRAIRVQ